MYVCLRERKICNLSLVDGNAQFSSYGRIICFTIIQIWVQKYSYFQICRNRYVCAYMFRHTSAYKKFTRKENISNSEVSVNTIDLFGFYMNNFLFGFYIRKTIFILAILLSMWATCTPSKNERLLKKDIVTKGSALISTIAFHTGVLS